MPRKIKPFQRLNTQDIEEYDTQLAVLRARLNSANLSSLARSRLHSRLGSLLLADPSTVHEGLALLESCTGLDGDDIIVWTIRHATALQYTDRHLEACDILLSAIAKSRPDGPYLDFALQHYGKCLVEMGEIARARACLEEAYELRKRKGDQTLIASTQRALAGL